MECSGAGLGQFFSTFPEPLVSERRLLSSWETVMSNLNFKSFYHKNLKMSQIFYKGMSGNFHFLPIDIRIPENSKKSLF